MSCNSPSGLQSYLQLCLTADFQDKQVKYVKQKNMHADEHDNN